MGSSEKYKLLGKWFLIEYNYVLRKTALEFTERIYERLKGRDKSNEIIVTRIITKNNKTYVFLSFRFTIHYIYTEELFAWKYTEDESLTIDTFSTESSFRKSITDKESIKVISVEEDLKSEIDNLEAEVDRLDEENRDLVKSNKELKIAYDELKRTIESEDGLVDEYGIVKLENKWILVTYRCIVNISEDEHKNLIINKLHGRKVVPEITHYERISQDKLTYIFMEFTPRLSHRNAIKLLSANTLEKVVISVKRIVNVGNFHDLIGLYRNKIIGVKQECESKKVPDEDDELDKLNIDEKIAKVNKERAENMEKLKCLFTENSTELTRLRVINATLEVKNKQLTSENEALEDKLMKLDTYNDELINTINAIDNIVSSKLI